MERSYLLKINEKIAERPQHMLMRVSVGIHHEDIDGAIEVIATVTSTTTTTTITTTTTTATVTTTTVTTDILATMPLYSMSLLYYIFNNINSLPRIIIKKHYLFLVNLSIYCNMFLA